VLWLWKLGMYKRTDACKDNIGDLILLTLTRGSSGFCYDILLMASGIQTIARSDQAIKLAMLAIIAFALSLYHDDYFGFLA
jgi:hypothetical protein